MANIALLGYGWLGLELAKKLHRSGHSVFGTSTQHDKVSAIRKTGFNAMQLDLNEPVDLEEVRSFFSSCTICVLSLPPKKNSSGSYERLCETAISFFSPQTRFIFTSSTGVYRDSNRILFEDELSDSDFVPGHPVRNAEKVLEEKLGEMLTIIRLSGLIGGGREPARFFAGKKQVPNGLSPLNLIHRVDAVALIERCIEKNHFGTVFHACADDHPTRKSFYTKACVEAGLEIPDFEENCDSYKIIDNSKAKKTLDFEYQYRLI